MELKQLQYFLTAAETLNFSRAAEQMYISQPALSYHIAELERELGIELFIRGARRVYLTPEGQSLLEPAREMLDRAERLAQLAQKGIDGAGGRLRIGFDNTEDHFELIGVTQWAADFRQRYPDVRMELAELPFTECADRVIYDDLDLAFLILRHRERLPPDLDSRPVYRSRIVMVIREDSDASTCEEAVRTHDLLLVGEKPRGNSRILKVLEEMKVEPAIQRVDSMTAAFVYAQAGQGILLLPETYYTAHRYPGFRTIPIRSEAADITHEVVWNRATKNQNVHKFLEMLPEV